MLAHTAAAALLSAAALAAPSGGSATAAPAAFVLADVLRLRAEPAEKGAVVGRLRIGTRVELAEQRGEWARVAAGDGDSRVEGWTRRALLGTAAITRDEALARAASSAGAERLGWLERAAAVDPGRAGTWLDLAAALEAAGKADRAAQARTVAGGGLPGFVASCSGDGAALVAEWTPAGPPRKLEDRFMSDTPGGPLPPEGARFRRELLRLADELPAAAWFRFGAPPLGGTPFPRPQLQQQSDECDEHWAALRLALGACAGEEAWLATTTPLAPLAPEPATLGEVQRKALLARDAERLDRVEARRIPGPPALLEVRFAGPARRKGTVHDPAKGEPVEVAKRVEGWALFGDGPEPLAYEVRTADDPEGRLPANTNPETAELGVAAWSTLPLRPGVRVAAILYRTSSGGTDGQTFEEWGFLLVTVDAAGRVESRKLQLYGFGSC